MKGERLILEARRSAPSLGLLIVLAVMAAVAFGFIAKNLTFQRPWEHYREVKVSFDDVKGIFPKGHQVRIHGVKVGIVKSSKLVNGRPVLTLSIEQKFGPIYKNAVMRIRPVTPLEDLYVDINSRGTPNAGEIKGNYVLPAKNTITPVDISRVLDTFDADTRERLALLLTEMGKGLSDNGGEKLKATFASLAPFLHVAQNVTQTMAERKVEIQRIITNFGQLSDALAEKDTQLDNFITQGNSTLGELAQHDQNLQATLSSLASLLPVMRSSFVSVDQLTGHLNPALGSLESISKQLGSGLNGLRDVGDEATPSLKALRPAVSQVKVLAKTLPGTASAMAQAFTRLNGQAPQFQRITNRILPCMNAIQRFFQNTPSVLKYSDASGAFPRADEIVDSDAVSPLTGGAATAVNLQKITYCTETK